MKLFFIKISVCIFSLLLVVFLLVGCNILPSVESGHSTTVNLDNFSERISRINEGLMKLTGQDHRTSSAIRMFTSGNADGGSAKAVEILKKRVRLEKYLIAEIGKAGEEYSEIAGKLPDEYNRQMQQIANDFEAEFDKALKDLNKQIDEFKEVCNIKKFDTFRNVARQHTSFIKALKNQRIDLTPEIAYFEQLKELVKLCNEVDKIQLLCLETVAKIQNPKNARMKIAKAMSEADMINSFEVLKALKVDTGNALAVLPFALKDSVDPTLLPAAPTHPDAFNISIEPDRGSGSTYREGDKIYFTLRASHDCWFILRTISSSSERVKQLVPNEYFREANFLRADTPVTIPSETMDFDFVAKNPPETQVIEVIASRNEITYNKELDRQDQGIYRGPSDLKKRMKTRDIDIQPRYVSYLNGGSYDRQYYSPDETGNALMARTFIRIVRDNI